MSKTRPALLPSPVRRLAALALLLVLCPAARAQARELHWKALHVAAQLDADGVLHVRERHHMVFTGDWNGGERIFRIEPGQELELHGITRVDPVTGATRSLQEGSLDRVDHYTWADARTLRWRSRATTDPGYDRTGIIYDIEYSLHGALRKENGRYLLAHDFAFADRPGVIEDHAVTLRLDPVWRTDGPQELEIHRGLLRPGMGNVVRLSLEYTGAGEPGGMGLGPRSRMLLAALFVIPALLLAHFYASEWIRGRFAPLDPPDATSQRRLEEDVLVHPAEVVGAAWDRETGSAEVAALVARLTEQGTLSSHADGADVLHLGLRADRESLSGYERALVDALFFGGRTETSTSDVRAHYEKRGFDPAMLIRSGVDERVAELVGPPAYRYFPLWVPTLLLFAAGTFWLWWTSTTSQVAVIRMVTTVLPLLVLAAFATSAAARWRARVDRGPLRTIGFLIPAFLVLAAAGELVADLVHVPALAEFVGETGGVPPPVKLGATLVALAMFNSTINNARSRERSRGLAFRKRLASARRYFVTQLAQPEPALRDEWFPYVLAFGLDGDAKRWFEAYGGRSDSSSSPFWTGSPSSGSVSSSSSGSSGGTPGWTGGGGAYGGGGATGSWAAAAGALSAGFSAPSSGGSSGGGGGGGGGGSSSGGGGGGGW